MKRLEIMAEAVAKLRAHFASTHTLEVFTDLVRDTPDVWTAPYFQCVSMTRTGWLVVDHETALKRLVVEHGRDFYTIANAFRPYDAGRTHFHRQEFTMADWVRADQSFHDLKEEVKRIMDEVLGREVRLVGKVLCETSTMNRFEVEYNGLELGNFYCLGSGTKAVLKAWEQLPSRAEDFMEDQMTAGVNEDDLAVIRKLPPNSVSGSIGVDRLVDVLMGII